MRFRIGTANDKYWVEGKIFIRWRRLPSLSRFMSEYDLYRESKEYVEYFPDMESAMQLVNDYRQHYDNKIAAYVEV